MTNLGYGDLTPVKPLARTVAYLEAVVGQFYVAVLVPGLSVSIFLVRTKTAKILNARIKPYFPV